MSLDPKHLRELCAKATPGPWTCDRAQAHRGIVRDGGWEQVAITNCGATKGHGGDNAAFIAEARTALPSLLDENDRLRAALRDCIAMLDAFGALKRRDEDRIAPYRKLAGEP